MNTRWHLNRAGIINFWLYDEAEFIFSSGRLILRGANGSGKSVTMQSLIPLVLDGDKRPWRLDPFGSRDRRIEYYLLGEADSNIFDRTGYLYLEFAQPEEERYLTIGIGLRARRSSPVNFWGFAITDNRRIGPDLLLYQRDFSQSQEAHIPLTRAQLEEVIGAGGWVVAEQGEYKRRVNKVLFGYQDLQSYQELLDLLIQIRSPKLSKDFKPSTIYEILTSALPPLQEDDLRPLSEVLADMNEIGDRLQELIVHRQEVEQLNKAYNQYNQYQLFTTSRALLTQSQDLSSRQSEEAGLNQEIKTLKQELTEHDSALQQLEEERLKTQTQYDTLSSSEALAKEQELERLHNEQKLADETLALYRDRVVHGEQSQLEAREQEKRLTQEITVNENQQRELLQQMIQTATDSNFTLHEAYNLLWEEQIPADDSLWSPWHQEIVTHETKLDKALSLARQETQLKEQTAAAEREVSAARHRRDLAEAEFRTKEQAVDKAYQDLQEEIFSWRKDLQELLFPDESLREILHQLSLFPDTPYSDLQAIVRDQQHLAIRKLAKIRADIETEQKHHQTEKEELQRQLKEWEQKKEPEPPRSPARETARQRRLAQGETGIPLYAACDFHPTVPENIRAALESALEEAGLLDAWISGNKMAVLQPGEEEVWIQADPHLLTPTLADYLVPTPPSGSGCTADEVDLLLRTIQVKNTPAATSGSYIATDGRFQLGCLLGQAAVKPQAQYIGKESRRRTREAEIARLKELIALEDEALSAGAAKLEALTAKEARLEAETHAFPDGKALIEAHRQLQSQQMIVDNTRQEVERKHEHHKAIAAQLFEASTKFHQFMGQWTIAHSEAAVEQAWRQLRYYKDQFSQLHNLWERWRGLANNKKQIHNQRIATEKRLAQDLAEQTRWQQRRLEIESKIAALKTLLQEMGIYDLHNKLLQLKDEEARLQAEIKRREKMQRQAENKLAAKETELRFVANQTAEALNRWKEKFQQWQLEWDRRLLPEWSDTKLEAAQPAVVDKLCRLIVQHYPRMENQTAENITNRLHDEFYSIRQSLLPYVPELDSDPVSGRRLIIFNRDRHNPLTPALLLQELTTAEEEQRLLLSHKDRELYEEILIHSVGRAIKQKIARAEHWVAEMNHLMQARETSSGLKLFLRWEPLAASTEDELDTEQLVQLLRTDPHLLRDDQIDRMVKHFRTRIKRAETEAEAGETLRDWIAKLLDYRLWFRFTLHYSKADQSRRELTDSRFNVLSGGEKAMAMYIPLLAAVCSRYSDADSAAPRIVSLDEAFAGVDEENLRDMFELLTQMDLDYIMTSQNLWGCYDTVPALAIYELYRPKDAACVSQIHYIWNGKQRSMIA
ncbi:MAG: TIGR02680 family protein [Firmicutes bacterium]|nr:TIGR02680 family protein [Bacillota bacterium]